MTTSTLVDHPWQIRSDFCGRLRIFHPGLSDSPGLRRHCAGVLHRTHWLLSHRINGLSGTLVLRFPANEKNQIELLLRRCFVDPFADSSFESLLSAESSTTDIVRSSPFRSALKTGATCGSILLINSLVTLPPLALGLSATMFCFPLLREFWSQMRDRWLSSGNAVASELLPSSSVEVALSATLISSGLAQELLVDNLLGSTTSALQSLSQNTDGSSLEFFDFLERFKNSVFLSCQSQEQNEPRLVPICDVQVGQRYEINNKCHVYLTSKLVEGELVVLNNLADGSKLPLRACPGDHLPFGATVLHGSAIAEVTMAFVDIPVFKIQNTLFEEESFTEYQQSVSSLYRLFVPPIQLGLAAWSLFSGFTERAIGLLAFSPAKDSERSRMSSAETALLDMRLNRVHISDIRALKTLSDLSTLLISIDALQYFGNYNYSEIVPSVTSEQPGDMLRMLSSIADYLRADPTTVFWGILEAQSLEPWPIDHLEITSDQPECCAYNVDFSNGKSVRIQFANDRDDVIIRFEGQTGALGSLLIRWIPDPDYDQMVDDLAFLGVAVQVVGTHAARLREPQDRLLSVSKRRQAGEKVGYLGNVIDDISAMAAAEVAIGFEEDPDGFISKTVCDVILAGDLNWLPRLIALARNYERSQQVNTNLIVGSSIILTLASFVSTLNPLQLIVLFNAPSVIAELNTLRSLSPNCSRFKST
tara:strand:- start:1559 stop:3667 length:2109 start_codon:yes stop_codon:yes gene_type:complete